MFFIEYGAIVGWLFIFGTALWLWPIFLPFILIATWAIVARKAARKRKLANTPEEA